MAIAIDGQPLWPAEIACSISAAAEHAQEISFRIEDLNAVVDRVRDVDVTFGIDSDVGRPREGSGVFLTRFRWRSTNGSLKFEGVCVENRDLVLHYVRDVEEPVLGIESNAAGSTQ